MTINFKIKEVSNDSIELKEFAEMVVNEWSDNILEEILSLPIQKTYVAIDKQGIVRGGSVICITPKNAYCLAYHLVQDVFRSHGLGSALLKKCKEFVTTEHPSTELQLLTEKWNERAHRFYEIHGFTFRRDISNYYTEGEDGCACLYVFNSNSLSR